MTRGITDAFEELRNNQEALASTVSDLTVRAAAIEASIEVIEGGQSSTDVPRIVAEGVTKEQATLQSRLDDLQDRSRPGNIFYRIPDTTTENRARSETRACNFLFLQLNLNIQEGQISRVHRLGHFVASQTPPIIVKFLSSKLKDGILSQRAKLKDTGVSICEDFCRATRQSRKHLIEFGKGSGYACTLRHNRLVMNGKIYAYCTATKRVC